MPSKDEIDAAHAAIERANEEMSGASYSELLREFAKAGLEAAEKVRDAERHRAHQALNDTALESAGMAAYPRNYTLGSCTGLSVCPAW